MRWGSYFAVCSAVISIGLALGLTMPLVSLRLESWGYGSFAIGVMASTPAVGVLLGAMIAGRLAARVGTPRLMQLCLLTGAASIGLLALLQSYPVWLLLRLLIGVQLTVVFILGESWINQLAVEKWRGRLVALYGTGYALSQLSGPVLLTFIGTADDRGFWFGVCLLIAGSLLLLGRGGAPRVDPHSASGRGLWAFCRGLPAIAWAVVLFAAFEAMILTLLPVYGLRQGFPQAVALAMVSTVVVGDALLQLPIGWLADRVSRSGLFGGCGLVLLLSSLAIPLLLQTPLIWPLLVLFGASAGGLFTLALILIGERYRDDALVLDPDQLRPAAAAVDANLVADARRHALQRQLADLLGQQRTVDDDPDFGVPQDRARIEVERTDEYLAPVEDHRLAVQAGAARSVQAPGRAAQRLVGIGAQLVELHAMFQQRHPIGCVAGMHGGHVGGFQGVGQQAHVDAAVGLAGEIVETVLGRNEIRRDQDQFLLHALEQARQVRTEQ